MTPTVTLNKRVGWSRTYEWDFVNFVEVAEGQTLSTAVITGGSGLTVGSPTISGSKVRCRVSGGTSGVLYTLTCTITTSGGDTLSQDGTVAVIP